MLDLTKEIGYKIKFYRKQRNMTMQQLANAICKSKSALSKYENGLISIDILTLYDIARALNVQIGQLICFDAGTDHLLTDPIPVPAFFQDLNQLYLYYYDGRSRQIVRSVADIYKEDLEVSYQVRLYMNIDSYKHYQSCENTYVGTLTHYNALSNFLLQNQAMVMEQYQLCIPHPYMDSPYKWALAYGISSRPLMPTSTKILVSKTILKETQELKQSLILSKEDIQLMKHYNMLVIQ